MGGLNVDTSGRQEVGFVVLYVHPGHERLVGFYLVLGAPEGATLIRALVLGMRPLAYLFSRSHEAMIPGFYRIVTLTQSPVEMRVPISCHCQTAPQSLHLTLSSILMWSFLRSFQLGSSQWWVGLPLERTSTDISHSLPYSFGRHQGRHEGMPTSLRQSVTHLQGLRGDLTMLGVLL